MPDQTTAPLPGENFIRTVLAMLVEDKDQLIVEARVDELGVLITLQVSDRDMGKLIGKNGQTIKSIRTLLRVIGGAANQRVNLKVLEPQGQPHLRPPEADYGGQASSSLLSSTTL